MPNQLPAVGPDPIESQQLLKLLELWHVKRRGREFPGRADFDPVELKFVLGSLLILEVLPGPRFRFRLHGSKLTEVAGYDMTGSFTDDLPDVENRRTLAARCEALLRQRKPMSIRKERPLSGRRYNYEALWLPLATDGTEIDMLMCGLVYLDTWAQARPERAVLGEGSTTF